MSRKKSQGEGDDGGADPLNRGNTPNAIVIRGSKAWREWLIAVAASERSKPTAVIDQALAEWAVRHGRPTPPERLGGAE